MKAVEKKLQLARKKKQVLAAHDQRQYKTRKKVYEFYFDIDSYELKSQATVEKFMTSIKNKKCLLISLGTLAEMLMTCLDKAALGSTKVRQQRQGCSLHLPSPLRTLSLPDITMSFCLAPFTPHYQKSQVTDASLNVRISTGLSPKARFSTQCQQLKINQ